MLQEFIRHEGKTLDGIYPRAIFKKAYAGGLIENEKTLLALLEDRSATAYIYNENLATEIADRVQKQYIPAIGNLIKSQMN